LTRDGGHGNLTLVNQDKTCPIYPWPENARVAIISGSYRAHMSYQENIWAERLALRGYQVRVFCPETRLGDRRPDRYEIQGVETRGIPNRLLYAESEVGSLVLRMNPHIILWFGPPQRFGDSLTKLTSDITAPVVVFMGQNRRMQAFDWRMKGLRFSQRMKAQAYRFIRGPVIGRAMALADLTIANTAETPEILSLYAQSPDDLSRVLPTPLGFDPDAFGYHASRRVRIRQEFKFKEAAVVALLSSRFAPEKAASIQLILDAFSAAAKRNDNLHLLVAGLDGGVISAQFRKDVAAHPNGHRIHCTAFAQRARLGDLYHGADIAVFARPSISCQEALGTGAYGLFSDDGSMDWLLKSEMSGLTFKAGSREHLTEALLMASDRLQTGDAIAARENRAQRSEWLNYDHIIDSVLSHLCRSVPRLSNSVPER